MNHDDTTEGDDAGEQQRWIDELLRSGAAAELEAAPAGAKFATAATIGILRRRQMRRRSLAVLAAAAVAAVWAWPESLPPRQGELTAPLVAQSSGGTPAVGNPSPGPSLQERGIADATFVGHGDAIAVPLVSNAANVTIVQLYPTTHAERRWRHERELQQILFEPNGG